MRKILAVKNKKKRMSRLAPSHQKNLDHIKLLFSDPDFEQTIAETRKFLELPKEGLNENGLSDQNLSKKVQQWHSQMHKRSNELIKSERLRDQVKDIKNKVNKKEIAQLMGRKQGDLLYNKLPENYLTDIVNQLIKECHLPSNYAEYLRIYIISGIITAPALSFSVISQYPPNFNNDFPGSLMLQPHTKLTDDDLKSVKKWTNTFFPNRLPNSLKPIKNLDKKLLIEKISQNKQRSSDATQKSYKINAKEIYEQVKNELGGRVTLSQIYDARRELKNLRNKRFKNKFGK